MSVANVIVDAVYDNLDMIDKEVNTHDSHLARLILASYNA
jgi:hypothetical protein